MTEHSFTNKLPKVFFSPSDGIRKINGEDDSIMIMSPWIDKRQLTITKKDHPPPNRYDDFVSEDEGRYEITLNEGPNLSGFPSQVKYYYGVGKEDKRSVKIIITNPSVYKLDKYKTRPELTSQPISDFLDSSQHVSFIVGLYREYNISYYFHQDQETTATYDICYYWPQHEDGCQAEPLGCQCKENKENCILLVNDEKKANPDCEIIWQATCDCEELKEKAKSLNQYQYYRRHLMDKTREIVVSAIALNQIDEECWRYYQGVKRYLIGDEILLLNRDLRRIVVNYVMVVFS